MYSPPDIYAQLEFKLGIFQWNWLHSTYSLQLAMIWSKPVLVSRSFNFAVIAHPTYPLSTNAKWYMLMLVINCLCSSKKEHRRVAFCHFCTWLRIYMLILQSKWWAVSLQTPKRRTSILEVDVIKMYIKAFNSCCFIFKIILLLLIK